MGWLTGDTAAQRIEAGISFFFFFFFFVRKFVFSSLYMLASSFRYLGFALVQDTIFYLTGGHTGHKPKATAKGEARGSEDLHLVTYNVTSGEVFEVLLLFAVQERRKGGCWRSYT